jgi:hypothetical protein
MKPHEMELGELLVEPSVDDEREWGRALDDTDDFRFFM